MKFFIAIATLSLFISVHGLTGCAKKTGADIDLVNKIKYGDFEFEDAKTKDFLLCMYTTKGYFSDGKVAYDYIMTLTDDSNRELVKKALDTCPQSGKTDEERVWTFAKCYSKIVTTDIYIEE